MLCRGCLCASCTKQLEASLTADKMQLKTSAKYLLQLRCGIGRKFQEKYGWQNLKHAPGRGSANQDEAKVDICISMSCHICTTHLWAADAMTIKPAFHAFINPKSSGRSEMC